MTYMEKEVLLVKNMLAERRSLVCCCRCAPKYVAEKCREVSWLAGTKVESETTLRGNMDYVPGSRRGTEASVRRKGEGLAAVMIRVTFEV